MFYDNLSLIFASLYDHFTPFPRLLNFVNFSDLLFIRNPIYLTLESKSIVLRYNKVVLQASKIDVSFKLYSHLPVLSALAMKSVKS